MSALLELDGVTRRFGGLNALEGVSFSVAQGEIVGLIGPNGAGKTTLINVITGVHPANGGRVRFDGADITRRRPHQIARLGLARTFQIVQPFPKMTVLENAAAGALFSGAAGSVHDAYAAARRQLEFTGLADLAHRPAATLTLARRKRLELAKSLAMKPRLLMLDEVNAGLDSAEIAGALELIREIAKLGVTIIVIEHLMRVVLSVAQRLVVLHHGQLIAQGPPHDVVRDRHVIEAYLGSKYAAADRALGASLPTLSGEGEGGGSGESAP
jgi:branched-chain amino acid transport system ATP-binding protein